MIDYRVYLVTDDPSRYTDDWLDNVIASVEGGVTCVQYRDTESAPDERYARARRLQDALKSRHTPLVINNDVELAAALKTEGVHVGQHDMPPEKTRALVGPSCEIGYSITNVVQVSSPSPREENSTLRLQLPTTTNLLGIGPIFDARKTKSDAAQPLGLAGLKEILSAVQPLTFNHQPVSTVAIGGITLENAAEILSTGVGGLAVVSAFSKSPDPFATAQQFRNLFSNL